jgi:hypothetical protein
VLKKGKRHFKGDWSFRGITDSKRLRELDKKKGEGR